MEYEIVNRLEMSHETQTTALPFIKLLPATHTFVTQWKQVLPKTRNRTVSNVCNHIVRGIHGALDNCGDIAVNYSSGYLQSDRCCQMKLLVNQEENGEAAGVGAVKESSS